MYSFIWISWWGVDFKDKGPKDVSKVTQYPELRGTIMSLELCDSDLTALLCDHTHRVGDDWGRAAVVTYPFGEEWSRTFPCKRAHYRFTHLLLIKPHPPLYPQCDHISRFLFNWSRISGIYTINYSHTTPSFLPPAPPGSPTTLPLNLMLS